MRAIEDYFQRDPLSEFWDATLELRESANEGRVGQFVILSEKTSNSGDLGGFRIFSRLWPWRKKFAAVIVALDCGFDEHRLPHGSDLGRFR